MAVQPEPDSVPTARAWAELAEAADRLDAMLHEFRDDLRVRAVALGLADDEEFERAVDQLAADVAAGRERTAGSLDERRQRWGA